MAREAQVAPSEHHYNLLTALHDRLEDVEVLREYLAKAKKDRADEWIAVWQRLLDNAEQDVELMRTEAARLRA